MGNVLLRWIPPQRPVCACPPLLSGGAPLPFWPLGSLPALVQTGKSSLTSGMGTVSLYSSRSQLLPLALSLECVHEKNLQFYSTWWTPALQQGPPLSPSSGRGEIPPPTMRPQSVPEWASALGTSCVSMFFSPLKGTAQLEWVGAGDVPSQVSQALCKPQLVSLQLTAFPGE